MRGVLALSALLLFTTSSCDRRALDPTDAGGDMASADAGPDGGETYEEQVLRACAVVTACAPDSWPPGMPLSTIVVSPALCVQQLAGLGFDAPFSRWADRRMIDLLLTCSSKGGGDCGQFHACFGGSWVDLRVCRSRAECRGSRIVSKDDQTLYFDCASLGGTCHQSSKSKDYACCKTTPCSEEKCVGPARLGRCLDGIYEEIDCQPAGALCVSYGATKGVCVGNSGVDGTYCDGSYTPVCLSSTRVRFCVHPRLHTYDCAQHPFFKTCGAKQGYACVGTDVPVDPFEPGSRCEGDTLVMEVIGYRGKVSCTELGFASCSETQKGLARCQP